MIAKLLPVNPWKAPKKKLRSRKRYLRRLLDAAATLELEVGDSVWYDQWHYHADWYGYGNLSWQMRAAHLKALSVAFNKLAGLLARLERPYQIYLCLNSGDSSLDAVFVHTPNPNKNNFPVVFDSAAWDIPTVSEYFNSLLPGCGLGRLRDGALQFCILHDR